MSEIDEEAVRKKIKEEMRLEQLEGRVEAQDEKIDRMAHALVDQIAERWDDKLALLRGDLQDWLREEVVTRGELGAAVRKEHAQIEAEKQSEARGNLRFWFFVVMNTLGLSSALGTAIFWIVTILKG